MRWRWIKNLGSRETKKTFDSGQGISRDPALPFDKYEPRTPSAQNCIDALPGWNTRFPDEYGVVAGKIIHFADHRILWAIERYGSVAGANVLEIGPMEGAHTFLLQQHGAHVTAVVANKRAFLKCLITKELAGMPRARFLLGDCVQYLEQNDTRYDLIVACGVLYHMADPLRFLEAVASRTDSLKGLAAEREERDFRGIRAILYRLLYYDVHFKDEFCGGIYNEPRWMSRASVLDALSALGFSQIEIAHEARPHPTQPCFSIFARKAAAASVGT